MKLPVWASNVLRWVSLVALIVVSWDIAVHAVEILFEGGEHGHEAHEHAHEGLEFWQYGIVLGVMVFSVWLWNGPWHKYCGCTVFEVHHNHKFRSPKFLLLALAGFGLHQLIEGATIGVSMGIETADNHLVMAGFFTHGIFDVMVAAMFFAAFNNRWKGLLAVIALVGLRVLGHYIGHDEHILPGWMLGGMLLVVVFLMGMFMHLPHKKKGKEETVCCGGHK